MAVNPVTVFTGLVETTGTVRARTARGPGARLSIGTTLSPLTLGEFISVHGACLTVQAIVAQGFEADASAETLACTTLGSLAVGSRVHLERAMALGGRMGGHIVTGHVDGKARLVSRHDVGESRALAFEAPAELARYIAQKGSVTLNGVSLTVNGVSGRVFDVMIIPHTLEVTTLGDLRNGDEVNLEVDLLARYVARILGRGEENEDEHGRADDPLVAKLKSAGYL